MFLGEIPQSGAVVLPGCREHSILHGSPVRLFEPLISELANLFPSHVAHDIMNLVPEMISFDVASVHSITNR